MSTAMVVSGTVLIAAGFIGSSGPVAALAGMLLLWSGIVKVVVLRIWADRLSTSSVASTSTPPSRHLADRLRSFLGTPG